MPPRFDLYTLQLFLAVIEEGSIAAAAQREHIAASALSKRLSELERMLGLELFMRRARGVEPTAAASTLARGARTLLHDAMELSNDLANHTRGTCGLVRLAANLSSITQFLPAQLRAFRQLQPGIVVDLKEMISSDVLRAVAENVVDIGIFMHADDLYGLDMYDYHRDRMALLVPRGHPLAGLTSVAFRDTLDFEHVGMHRGSAANLLLAREAAAAGKALKLNFQVTSYDALMAMVREGLGVGIIPVNVMALYTGQDLRAIPLTDAWASRQLKLCVRPGERLAPAARSLLDFLVH